MEHDAVRLSYHAPYDWPATMAFLAERAIEGVERVESGIYRRTIRCDGLAGTLEVAHDDVGAALVATVRGLPAAASRAAVERVRRMFDLDADLRAIAAHLTRDPSMAPLVAARPALRVLRGWDGFEVAARSVIGQQVTVARARHLNGILADRCGREWPGGGDRLRRVFPTAQHVLDADLSAMGMPGARVTTLKTVASAVLAEPRLFDRATFIDETIARLRAIRGIGDWTAHYIAMRACGEPDAFPATDIGLLRGAAAASGRRPTPQQLLARAEAWRPWRAYAAHQLWALDRASRQVET
ncbi:MAG: DNA-3-methyladenine glycosylase 2 family protein [Acidobacteria bacterium]|nr:DNA-3-methyladenine glycosylase 2 family protein [Acidobacteriota bacterium]